MNQPSECTVSFDRRFDDLVLFNAELELLADGFRWVEGPVWFGDHNCLLFSDIPNNRTMRWSPEHGVSVFREPSDYANGQTRDLQGRLISCHHASRCLTRLEPDGKRGHLSAQEGDEPCVQLIIQRNDDAWRCARPGYFQ